MVAFADGASGDVDQEGEVGESSVAAFTTNDASASNLVDPLG